MGAEQMPKYGNIIIRQRYPARHIWTWRMVIWDKKWLYKGLRFGSNSFQRQTVKPSKRQKKKNKKMAISYRRVITSFLLLNGFLQISAQTASPSNGTDGTNDGKEGFFSLWFYLHNWIFGQNMDFISKSIHSSFHKKLDFFLSKPGF
jgi:hypothetical protein